MGLDVGSKTIGVSLSDPLRITTSPLTTLRRTSLDADCEKLLELANHHTVTGIVIGLPRNMDGSRSETESLIDPILKYLRLSHVDVGLQDERLSTKAAEKKMAQENLPISERKRRKDEFAAAVILEWYIQEL
jgi:putative Holliday junction resolvase